MELEIGKTYSKYNTREEIYSQVDELVEFMKTKKFHEIHILPYFGRFTVDVRKYDLKFTDKHQTFHFGNNRFWVSLIHNFSIKKNYISLGYDNECAIRLYFGDCP